MVQNSLLMPQSEGVDVSNGRSIAPRKGEVGASIIQRSPLTTDGVLDGFQMVGSMPRGGQQRGTADAASGRCPRQRLSRGPRREANPARVGILAGGQNWLCGAVRPGRRISGRGVGCTVELEL